MDEENDKKPGAENAIGYGKPPVETQFKKGQSGNPTGRPPKSLSRRAIVERVLTENQRLNNQPKGERVRYTRLELIIMQLKQMAARGDHQATKLFTSVDDKYGRQEPDHQGTNYLVVPEVLTKEEWIAKYSPKEKPPDYDP